MQYPMWAVAHTHVDVRIWYDILTEFNIDLLGKQQLFLLAQHSPWGYAQANCLLSALLGSQRNGECNIGNPSHWLHMGITNARTRLSNSGVPDFPERLYTMYPGQEELFYMMGH